MTAPSLAEALEAYELAIANGAGSYPLSEAFADLAAAHHTHATELYEREQALDAMLADPEGQALVAAIHARKAQS